MENYTLEQAIAKMTEIASNPSPMAGSLFTAENVLGILKSIQLPPAKVIREMPENWVEDVTDAIATFIEEDFNDFVDYDDVNFELNRDTLSLESVGFHSRSIMFNSRCFVEGRLVELFEPEVEEEVEEVEELVDEVPQENEVLTEEKNEENEAVQV